MAKNLEIVAAVEQAIMEIKAEPIEAYVDVDDESENSFNRIPSTTDIGALNLWTSKATACLINEYKKYHNMVGQSTQLRSLREMFEMISLEMQRYGFFFSSQKCENKWRVLERKYKNLVLRERLKKPGRMKHYGHWEHKKAMDEIFSEKKRHQYLDDRDFPLPSSSAKFILSLQQNPEQSNQPQGDASMTSVEAGDSDHIFGQETAKSMLEKFIKEIRNNFAVAEEHKERRHKEMMTMRQKELDVQKKLLEIKEQKLELQRSQILAAAQRLQMNY